MSTSPETTRFEVSPATVPSEVGTAYTAGVTAMSAATSTTANPPTTTTIARQLYDPDVAHIDASFHRWREVPALVVPGARAVWTGSEVLFWGGRPGRAAAEPPHGAAFDPVSDSWRTIAAPAAAWRSGHVAVWTGEQMLIWGGRAQRRADDGRVLQRTVHDGLAYDPFTDVWTSIPEAPIRSTSIQAAVWTGEELIVVVGLRRQLSDPVRAAAFDPVAGTWRRLPDLAVTSFSSVPGSLSATWAGDAMLATGSAIGDDVVAIYRPRTDEWEQLPVPIGDRAGHSATWTDSEVVVWGGSDRESLHPVGYAIDPGTSTWRRLPPPPVAERTGHGAAWTGNGMLMWGGVISSTSIDPQERVMLRALFEPAHNRWTLIDADGGPLDLLGQRGVEVLWLGESALLWSHDRNTSGALTLAGAVVGPSSGQRSASSLR